MLHWLYRGSRVFLILKISKTSSWIQVSASVQKQSGSCTLGQRSALNPKQALLLPEPQSLLPREPSRQSHTKWEEALLQEQWFLSVGDCMSCRGSITSLLRVHIIPLCPRDSPCPKSFCWAPEKSQASRITTAHVSGCSKELPEEAIFFFQGTTGEAT